MDSSTTSTRAVRPGRHDISLADANTSLRTLSDAAHYVRPLLCKGPDAAPFESARPKLTQTDTYIQNLTHATSSSAVVKVDTTVGPGSIPDASTGRFSVRLHSKKQYETGLFVFDVQHTPYGCATWPALWLTE